MRVAVIGSGKIGGTLAKHWGAAGHQVIVGARDPSKAEVQSLLGEIGSGARAVPITEAVADAEAVLFAVPGAAMAETLEKVGPSLGSRVAIDATNNRGGSGFNNVDKITAAAPQAQVYRAFNTYGWENLDNPTFGSEKADQIFAGPDGGGRALVEELITSAGLHPVWIGGLDQVPVVDSIVLVWFGLVSAKGTRHIGLKVLG